MGGGSKPSSAARVASVSRALRAFFFAFLASCFSLPYFALRTCLFLMWLVCCPMVVGPAELEGPAASGREQPEGREAAVAG